MLDFERLERLAPALRQDFGEAKPFPHVVIDDFLPAGDAERLARSCDAVEDGWDHYRHYNENKLAITDAARLPEQIRALVDALQAPRFLAFLERISGVDDLLADPDLEGGGLHRVLPGGTLNVHSDFLSHSEHRTWSRQLNLLLYFNPGWQRAWDGDLELWDRDLSSCVHSIAPELNRCVIFQTARDSYHGHPRALACPPDRCRQSLALYYFRDEQVVQQIQATHYRALPDDPPLRRALVAADSALLRVYAFLKRTTPLSDRAVSRILRHL